MLSRDWRDQVIREAYSWCGTPYHHCANVKGVGVDCAMLLVEVFRVVGVIAADFDPRPYSQDWMLHRSEEIFMQQVFAHSRRIEVGRPGDVLLYRMGRTASHGAIIVDAECMIHANSRTRQVERMEMGACAERLDSIWTVRDEQ